VEGSKKTALYLESMQSSNAIPAAS